MSLSAPLPRTCPDLPQGQGKSTLPLCPSPLREGQEGAGHCKVIETADKGRVCPAPRKRLYRRPEPPAVAPIRKGRLRRVQVEKVTPHRAEGFVMFNDGNEASVMRGPILEGLRLAERNGSMMDVELADYGNGWAVERILPASRQWARLEVVC
jgi:hypothetical protein